MLKEEVNNSISKFGGILGDKYPLNLYYAYGIRNSFGITRFQANYGIQRMVLIMVMKSMLLNQDLTVDGLLSKVYGSQISMKKESLH